MKKPPYHEIIDIKAEQKEYSRLCIGKSKKFTLYSEWEDHIKSLLANFGSHKALYNFKHYCINAARVQGKAPDTFLAYIGLLIPLYLETIFKGEPALLTLFCLVAILVYALIQNKKLAKASFFFTDIVDIIDEVENTIEFNQSAPKDQNKGEMMKNESFKKIVKQPLTWLIVAELLVVVVLFLCGFRITYAPGLENSWDAISACAGWASVFVAGLAIYYAIRVPKKIADRQDRIALFEKRLDVYLTAQKLLSCANQIKDFNDNGIIMTAFFMAIGKREDTENVNTLSLLFELDQMERTLMSGEFLFPQYNADQMTLAIIEARDLLIEADKSITNCEEPDDSLESVDASSAGTVLSEKAGRHKEHYCELCFAFMEECVPGMEKVLNLTDRTQ